MTRLFKILVIGLLIVGVIYLLNLGGLMSLGQNIFESDQSLDNTKEIINDGSQDIINETSIPISRTGDLAKDVVVTKPSAGDKVDDIFQIEGQAPGNWFFEATAPVLVADWDGLIIGESYISADGEWMTTDLVPFSGEISYTLPSDSAYARGTLILKRSNESGLPQHDASVEIPIELTLGDQ